MLLLSLKMRSRSSSSSFISNSCVLTVATSSGLILQICLIMALSLRCRLVFVSGQDSLAWSMALRTQALYTWPRVLLERWRDVRTGSSSLNFFQAVFTRVVTAIFHSLRQQKACHPGSRRKLPPPAYQVRPGLHSVAYHQ